MNRPLRYIFSLLVILPVVFFAIGFLFGDDIGDGSSMFESFGSLLEGADTQAEVEVDKTIYDSVDDRAAPLIKYVGGVQETGTYFSLKEQLLVYTEDGEQNGAAEEGFSIYLKDVRNCEGMSVLNKLRAEDVAFMEQISMSLIYIEEMDLLYINNIGNYIFVVKVYGSNGASMEYEFTMPVEIGD